MGIDDYPHYTWFDIEYAVDDAVDMRSVLVNEQGWSSSNIELLTNDDAHKSGILNLISSVSNIAAPNNTTMFYFAGHGSDYFGSAAYNAFNGQNYISPSDLQNAFKSGYDKFCCFIDACYSGQFPGSMTKGFIGASCEYNEYAREYGGILQHGIYTYYLLQGLTDNNADPPYGIISAQE